MKKSSGFRLRRRGTSERRVQSHSTPSETKPGSLWTCGPAPSSATTPRVCHKPPDCTRGSAHSSAHPGTLWCWLSSRLRRCELAWCGLPFHHLQRFVRCIELCPQALNRSDLHFEGAGNGPVVITWIGRVHELYSGVSPISLVEHCVTFRHDRRLLSLLGFVHNWPTSWWSARKKENQFSLNGNGIMSSFLGQQFYFSTLYIYVHIYVCVCVCVYVHICMCVCTYVWVCVCVYVHICMCVCVWVCVYVHICVCVCVHTHIHMCTYTYVYTYVCVHMCLCINNAVGKIYK